MGSVMSSNGSLLLNGSLILLNGSLILLNGSLILLNGLKGSSSVCFSSILGRTNLLLNLNRSSLSITSGVK